MVIQLTFFLLVTDYEPIEIILPNGTSFTIRLPFTINSNDPPPLCAVYSPLSLKKFYLQFYIAIGGTFFAGLEPYHRRDPIGEHLSTLQLIPNKGNDVIENLFSVCIAKTVWEEKSYTYRIQFDRGGKKLLNAELEMYVLVGSFCFL